MNNAIQRELTFLDSNAFQHCKKKIINAIYEQAKYLGIPIRISTLPH